MPWPCAQSLKKDVVQTPWCPRNKNHCVSFVNILVPTIHVILLTVSQGSIKKKCGN